MLVEVLNVAAPRNKYRSVDLWSDDTVVNDTMRRTAYEQMRNLEGRERVFWCVLITPASATC